MECRKPDCIWLLHYRPFHWLGCTELMNWGSGQEHIMGRNEFLSQPSQEATGPDLSQQKPWLNEEEGSVSVPIHEEETEPRWRTWWNAWMLDQYTREEPQIHGEPYYCWQQVLMISCTVLVISVCFLLVTDTIGITFFLIVYSISPPERILLLVRSFCFRPHSCIKTPTTETNN